MFGRGAAAQAAALENNAARCPSYGAPTILPALGRCRNIAYPAPAKGSRWANRSLLAPAKAFCWRSGSLWAPVGCCCCRACKNSRSMPSSTYRVVAFIAFIANLTGLYPALFGSVSHK